MRFEALVLVAFRDKVNFGSVAAVGYIITIAINVLTALIEIIDILRVRPSSRAEGTAVPAYVRGLVIFFTINLGILALGGILAQVGGRSTEGGIFPEPLTLFTVRAFAAFFAAICLERAAADQGPKPDPDVRIRTGWAHIKLFPF